MRRNKSANRKLYAIPIDAAITTWAIGKNLTFLQELVFYTINNFLHFQKKDSAYNEWAQYDWNPILFSVVANALLHLPPAQTETLLAPFMEKWEQAPSMMEALLRQLSLAGSSNELEQRLLEVCVSVGEQILSSPLALSPPWRMQREIHDILGQLIFVDYGVTWKVNEWKPLRQLTGFIDLWVTRVGHDPGCFPKLVRLLRNIGFSLMPEYGITWLYQCIQNSGNDTDFLRRSEISGALAELLQDTWLEYGRSIGRDVEQLRRFAFLVDKAAEQGEQVAVRLQAQLQS